VADDGGYLDLARSQDARSLWMRRRYDDGSQVVHRFDLVRPLRPGPRFVLQFVDGVVVESQQPSEKEGCRILRRTQKGTWFELVSEAWLVDWEGRLAYRPSSSEAYPLVTATNHKRSMPRELQWMTFSRYCPEVKNGCVYFGRPTDVANRYFATTSMETGQDLWIAPASTAR
jgi:hypothetical protein